MGIWSAMVLIVLIAVVGGVIMDRQKRRPRDDESQEKAALHREISELNQRIQTLERIATDKSQRLSDEIDTLDQPGKE